MEAGFEPARVLHQFMIGIEPSSGCLPVSTISPLHLVLIKRG